MCYIESMKQVVHFPSTNTSTHGLLMCVGLRNCTALYTAPPNTEATAWRLV